MATNKPGKKKPDEKFHTTLWSIVSAAIYSGDAAVAQRAVNELCNNYYLPIFAYFRRSCGDQHRTEDLTQSFFDRLIHHHLANFDERKCGRFRSWLLTLAQGHGRDRWKYETAKQRSCVLTVELDFEMAESRFFVNSQQGWTAEEHYERAWCVGVFERAFERLQKAYQVAGDEQEFERLAPLLPVGDATAETSVAATRFRREFRDMVRLEVSMLVQDTDSITEEMKFLHMVLTRS